MRPVFAVPALAGAVIAACAISRPVHAQTFQCPKPGTIVSFGAVNTMTYQGADPADPDVCVGVHSARGEQRRLFDWYTLPIRGDDKPVRVAYRAVMSGQQPQASYTITLSSMTGGGGGSVAFYQDFDRTLRRLGPQTITIGTEQFQTMVYEQIERFQGRENTQKLYYDLASRVWVRADNRMRDGITIANGWSVTAVKLP